MTDLEKLQKKRRAIAAKLTNPRPVELPSGAFRCQKMINGQRYSVVNEDPQLAHAEINAIATRLLSPATKKGNITFKDAYKGFIDRNRHIFSPATILGYDRIVKNHYADFSPVLMRDITQAMIQAKVNQLSRNHAPKTVHNIYGLFTSVYYDEFPDAKLSTNLPQKVQHEIAIPTEQEIAQILEAITGTKYELGILLAMWLGLRASEIRGITWDCIDGDRLYINKAIVDGVDGAAVKQPKTTAGYRWLVIPSRIKSLIDQQPRVNEYVVQLSGHAIYSGFSRICEKAGIPHYRLHDLRHVFASVSISLNIPLEYIRRDIGHKSDHMLRNVYGHMMSESKERFAQQRNDYYASLTVKPAEKSEEQIKSDQE